MIVYFIIALGGLVMGYLMNDYYIQYRSRPRRCENCARFLKRDR